MPPPPCASPHRSQCPTTQTTIAPLIFASLLTLLLLTALVAPRVIPHWVQFIAATAIQFTIGLPFYRSSYYALKERLPTRDVLIALGSSAAYLYSTAFFFLSPSHPLYFEIGAAILTLVTLGNFLERGARRMTTRALEHLIAQAPPIAHRILKNMVSDIAASELVVGDLFKVGPGEKIPMDAEIIEGSAFLDESLLTGESLPRFKTKGALIYAGTLNTGCEFTARVTATSEQTLLKEMADLVTRALESHPPRQRRVDTIAALFIPCVIVISLITFAAWWVLIADLERALDAATAVLIIACPCALGLATPIASATTIAAAAKRSILFRSSEVLEQLPKLSLVAFDKTGTLTEGRTHLAHIQTYSALYSESQLLVIAQALEKNATHPLGRTFFTTPPATLELVTDFIEVQGKGVEGTLQGQRFYLGSILWMREQGLKIDHTLLGPIEGHHCTLLSMAIRGQNELSLIGLFAIEDRIRDDAAITIAALKKRGIEPVMLTGDRTSIASPIAQELNIAYYADLLPEAKIEKLLELSQKRTRIVGMVGDGINDAPALATADIGFAITDKEFASIDLVIEAADIILMTHRLYDLIIALEMGKRTERVIGQNLFLVFVYNILALPIAALGLLNPMIAAIAMVASSLSVVLNALRLLRAPRSAP